MTDSTVEPKKINGNPSVFSKLINPVTAVAVAVPLIVLFWWMGLIAYRLIDGEINDVSLHLGADGFDWKMKMPEKNADIKP